MFLERGQLQHPLHLNSGLLINTGAVQLYPVKLKEHRKLPFLLLCVCIYIYLYLYLFIIVWVTLQWQ